MKTTKKCAFCGRMFTPNSGMQKYCTVHCADEAKKAKKKRQQDLLNAVEPVLEIQRQEYLTFSKAAILMGCSRQYIYKLVAQGRLRASRISNRMERMNRCLSAKKVNRDKLLYISCVANSYMGYMRHMACHRFKNLLVERNTSFHRIGNFKGEKLIFVPFIKGIVPLMK